MELKAKLDKPCFENQRLKFIVDNIDKYGYEYRETEEAYEAWGPTEEEIQARLDELEQRRIAMLNMTKYDFYKKVCVPNGISYSQLMELVNSSEETMAAWNLCERLYRGDTILIGAIHQFLPNLTDEQLTQIFENQ